MAGLTRLERAEVARAKARQMQAQARKLEADEREASRKKDVARKAILGGAMLASIRAGRILREDWDRLILPGISDRDRARLMGWPWVDDGPSEQPKNDA